MLPNTVAFSSGLVLEPPKERRPHFADVFAASGETCRLLRAGFGYEEGVPALPISREREGAPSPAVRGARLAFSSLFTEADRLPAAQQLLQRLIHPYRMKTDCLCRARLPRPDRSGIEQGGTRCPDDGWVEEAYAGGSPTGQEGETRTTRRTARIKTPQDRKHHLQLIRGQPRHRQTRAWMN